MALYSCGMSQRDIPEQIKNLYDVEISPELVSKITDKIMPEITAWQSRPLNPVYPFVFMDAIHYKVKENHQYQTKAAYVVLGIDMDGRKDILGVWIGEHESSKFWLSVLNDLKSRITRNRLSGHRLYRDPIKFCVKAEYETFFQTRMRVRKYQSERLTIKSQA
ncbi:MAG: hypothetical protein ACFWUC_06880 [Oscillospiraceae bacterium]